MPLFNQSNSAAITVNVGLPATTTTLTAPSSTTYGSSVTLSASVAPAISSNTAPTGSVTFTVTATYSGDGNYASSTASQSVTVNPLQTGITVTASTVNPVYGQQVNLTATVTDSAGIAPTGTVTFYYNGSSIGQAGLNSGSNGTASATLLYSSLPVGVDSVTAVYAGGGGFEGSTTNTGVSITVGAQPLTTTTMLAVSPSGNLYVGDTETFTATVSSTAGTPSGYVTFLNGTTQLGTGTLNASGQASFSTSLPEGSYSITAAYQGNTAYSTSTSTPAVSLTVSAALTASQTTLTITPSSAVQEGANVTFTATVASASSSSAITPTGTVTFWSGTQQIAGPLTLNGGTASYSTTSLGAGGYSVTAVYSGDGNYATSTSTASSLTVAAPTPSFTLTATPTNLTLTSGQTGAAIITLVPTYGYSGTITLSCGTLPTNVTCSFSPATLTATGTNTAVQSTLTITTSAATTTASAARIDGAGRNGSMRMLAFLFLPSGLLLWGFAARRKQFGQYLPLLVLGLLMAGLAGLSGCGGGNGGSVQNATPGTSQITVTAAGSTGSQSQTLNLSLTVTQ